MVNFEHDNILGFNGDDVSEIAFYSAHFCRRTYSLSTVKWILKNHALIFKLDIKDLEWTVEIPSFGYIRVLDTGI